MTASTPRNVSEALRRCYLFSSLPDDDIDALAMVSAQMSHARGTQIFSMGDDADGLRIVLAGVVRVWIADADGQELTVVLLEEGDSLGEIALFDGLPRTATATALEDVRCLFVPRHAVEKLLEQNLHFAKQVIQILCETLRRNTDEIGAITFRCLISRLAQKLCVLAVSYAQIDGNTAQFTRKFSQGDLAKMLGVTREAINKQLTKLAKDGLIDTQNGFLVLHDMKALMRK